MPEYPSPGTFEMITVSNTAIGITEAIYKPITGRCAGAQPFSALITSSAAIRYTLDGTDPVATTTGHLLAAGGEITINGKPSIMKLKMIREAGDSLVAVTCFF